MEYDVTIVGAGPTGASLAILLGQAGHRVLVVERDEDVYPLPRAVHMDHEIVRVMQQLGVLDPLKPLTSPVGRYVFENADGDILLEIDGGDRLANSGHPASLMFVQPELEQLLRERMDTLETVDTLIGVNVTRVIPDDVPAIEIEHRGGVKEVRSRFLVGCDGASSLVRQTLSPGIIDLGFDEPWVVIDTKIKGELALPHDTAFQFCDPSRPTTCVPAGPGRRRWEFMLLPDETPDQMRDPGSIWPLLAPWGDPDTLELVRIAVYRFHALMVDRWRHGNVLLAGDAAHQTPPFMGQGLCSSIRDAVNVAWKLDRVLQGTSPASLLDSYEAERAPHFRHVVETSVAMGRIVCELDPAAAKARDSAMIEARAAGKAGPGRSQDGQVVPLVDGAIRVGDAGAGLLCPQPEVRRDSRVAHLDDVVGCGVRLFFTDPALLTETTRLEELAITPVCLGNNEDGYVETGPPGAATWLNHYACAAALVRPDHYVFGTATSPAGTSALIEAWQAAVSGA